MMFFSIKKYLFFLVLLLLLYSNLFAEGDSLKNTLIRVTPGYGVIIRHREAMGNLMRHVGSLKVEYGKQTYGQEMWEQLYRYPEYGVGYYFADLNDPIILGYVNSVYAYLNSPFIKTNKFLFNYQFAIGFSYLNKYFDYRENYTNLAIGSHFNAYFNLSLNASYRLSKKIELTAALAGCHYSNGAFKQPNLGINVVSFDLGVKYFLHEIISDKKLFENPAYIKNNEFSVIMALGAKSVPPIRGPNYFMTTISFYFSRQINHKRKIGIGTDIFYDETLYNEFDINKTVHFTDVLRNGVYVSHEFLMKKLSIAIQLGAYTYTSVKPFFPLYTRLALRYDFLPRMFANISLKAHMGVADFIEWGVGYRFSGK